MWERRTGTGGGILERRAEERGVTLLPPTDDDIEEILVGMRVMGGDLFMVGLRKAAGPVFISGKP